MRHSLVIALAISLTMAGAATASDDPGRDAYRRYCGACHGLDGAGDGIVSGAMSPKPSNLTLLAKAHAGKFPTLLVMQTIDGRQRVTAHGDTAMPVWGEVFNEEHGKGIASEMQVRGQIQQITNYLATIQVK